jgi:hypothetical protein
MPESGKLYTRAGAERAESALPDQKPPHAMTIASIHEPAKLVQSRLAPHARAPSGRHRLSVSFVG